MIHTTYLGILGAAFAGATCGAAVCLALTYVITRGLLKVLAREDAKVTRLADPTPMPGEERFTTPVRLVNGARHGHPVDGETVNISRRGQ